MSASAVKTSIPGVGNTQNPANHTMMPMNMVAQKVPATDTANMKPLSGSNYVTLQNSGQALSLIQEHRAPPFPAPFTNSLQEPHKEIEQDQGKVVFNGTDQPKEVKKEENPVAAIGSAVTITPVAAPTPNSNSTNVNNSNTPVPTSNLSTSDNVSANDSGVSKPSIDTNKEKEKNISAETPSSEKTSDTEAMQKSKETIPAKTEDTPDSKSQDKKPPINATAKESETVVSNSTVQPKATVVINKIEDIQPKNETPSKTTPTKQSSTVTSETTVKTDKVEIKDVKTPVRSTKKKVKEVKETKEIRDAKEYTPDTSMRSRRNRTQTTPYQSPIPEMSQIVKNLSKPKPVTPKQSDDKLTVFYKHEFMAVRNTEGSFYVCQAMQNIYKTSKRIKIRWLSQDKNNGEIYSPDFYDHTEFDCILTNLNLNKVEKNKYQLTKYELLRTENILKRAIDVEAGVTEKPPVTEEHPDGLDLSLYRDEAQLKKRKGKASSKGKRQRQKSQKDSASEDESSGSDDSDTDSESSNKAKSPKKSAGIETKSPNKSPTRSERFLNRNKPVATPNAASTSSTSSTPSTSRKRAAPVALESKQNDVKKAATTPPAKTTVTPVAVPSTSSNTNSPVRGVKPKGSNSAPTSEIKTVSANLSGRPKRQTTNTTTSSSSAVTSEDSTPRKKPRGRA